jgi:hypothetical protein
MAGEHGHPVLERLKVRDHLRTVGDRALDRTELGSLGSDGGDGTAEVVADGRIGVQPQGVGRRDVGEACLDQLGRIRRVDEQSGDTPSLLLQLVGKVGHHRRAHLRGHQHMPLIPKEIAAPVEVARVAEQGDDDREVRRCRVSRFDRASAPPGEQVLEVEGDESDRQDQGQVRQPRRLGLRLNDPLRDVLPGRARVAGLALLDLRLRGLSREDVHPVVPLEHGREDQRHQRHDRDATVGGAMHVVPFVAAAIHRSAAGG